jgi:hypothetical protein
MLYAISAWIQSVPQWLLPASSRDGLPAGMDSLLRVRFPTQPEPMEVG